MISSAGGPALGHGVGLRVPHYERALTEGLDVDWVECISENFFGGGGRPRAVLRKLAQDMPLVFHGVSMGIGSLDGPSDDYLRRLSSLVNEFDAPWFSDHLCFTHLDGVHSHDLLPLPYTEEALELVCRNVRRVQDCVRKPFLLENVSSYVGYHHSTMTEWEFLAEVVERTDCRLLLDVNNVVVSAKNHDFDPLTFIRGVPAHAVWQLHLANHTDRARYKFDSHLGPVPEEVWALYDATVRVLGPVPSLVEWDEDIPEWEVLREQQRQAVQRENSVLNALATAGDEAGDALPAKGSPRVWST